MTDLQVAQPVFTLVLHLLLRLRATALPTIIRRGWDIHACRATCFRREEESLFLEYYGEVQKKEGRGLEAQVEEAKSHEIT
jgi:hypothetical protein